jgi:hypothetical protein
MENGQRFNPYKIFLGAFIPNAVLINPELSDLSKLVYARLCQYAGTKGYCWPKQETLAKEVAASIDRVQHALKLLESEGFIKREKPEGKNRLLHKPDIYTFLWKKEWEESPQDIPEDTGDEGTEDPVPGDRTDAVPGGGSPTVPKLKGSDLKGSIPFLNSGSSLEEPSLKKRTVFSKRAFSSTSNFSSGGDVQLDLPLAKAEAEEPPKPPVKRFNLHVLATHPESLAKEELPKLDNITNEMNKIGEYQAQDAHARYIKENKTPTKNIPEDVELLVEHWESLGFRKADKIRASKTFNRNISYLKKIKNGSLIPDEKRKFSTIDIQESMDTFAKITFDDKYGPNKEIKKKFSEMYLHQFIFNPRNTKGILSQFLECYGKELQEKSELVPNNHPEITNKIRNFFFAYPLAGIKKRLTEREENHFRLTANKIDDIREKIGHRFCGISGGNHELADLLCSSIRAFYGNNVLKITPGSFSSSFAFSLLIKYMNEKGYLVDDQSNRHWETGE